MELMSYRIVTVRKDNSIKLMRKLLTNVAAVPRLPKKITLARNVFAMVNERDKKHQLHDKRENLKRCEIKQLPNCWPGKPFKISRFSLLFLLFPSFFSPLESSFVSWDASVSPPVLAKSCNLARSSAPGDSRASFSVHSQSSSVSRDITYSSMDAFRRVTLSSSFTLLLPSLRKIRSWKDLIRPDTTETSAGSQLWDYPADPFRLDAVLQIPFPTGCAAYLSIGPTTFRSDDQNRSGNPTRPANMTRIRDFSQRGSYFSSNTIKLDSFQSNFLLMLSSSYKIINLKNWRYTIYENSRNLKIHFNGK